MGRRRALVAGFLSLLVPGLGQMYAGRSTRGAAVLAMAIVIAGLNLIFLLLFALADPEPTSVQAYRIPRIGHDVVVAWSIVFWIWVIVDAGRSAVAGK
jgi:TM2 domain-containing membrane protein YozV